MNPSSDLRMTRIPLSQGAGQMPSLGFDSIKSTLIFNEYDAVLVDAMMRWLGPKLSQIGLLCTS